MHGLFCIYGVIGMEDFNIDISTGLHKYRLVFITAAFGSGILLGSIYTPYWMVTSGGVGLAALFIFLNQRHLRRLLYGCLAAAFLLGLLDYGFAAHRNGITAAGVGSRAEIECIVVGDPVYRDRYTQYVVFCRKLSSEGRQYGKSADFFLRIRGKAGFRYGDLLQVEGVIQAIDGKRNPGDFDFQRYYWSKNIYGIVNAEGAALLEHNRQNALAAFLHGVKTRIKHIIFQALPETEAAVLYGILTGDKGELEEDLREAYARTGLSHILSVSGLHIGFLMLLIRFLLHPLKLGIHQEGGVILLVILCYILMIGAPLPAVRAFIMLLVLLAGKMTGRQYDLLLSVSFAALTVLVFKPMAVHDPGFVISFGTMYAITLLQQPIYQCLKCLPFLIRDTFALSLAVWIGITPILAVYFNYISLISVFINLLAVPIAFLITLAGFIRALLGAVLPGAALYVLSTAYYLIRLLNLLTQKSAGLNLAGFYLPALPIYVHMLYFLMVVILTNCFNLNLLRVYRQRAAAWAGLGCLLAVLIYLMPGSSMKLVYFDVGQGDSACIITPGRKAVLIDGGGSSKGNDYYYDVGGKVTLPAVLRQGVWHLDTVIASHLHDDHIEGLLQVLTVYKPDRMVFPAGKPGVDYSGSYEELLNRCRERGIQVLFLQKGDEIRYGEQVVLTVLSPEADAVSSSENNRSLVIRIAYKHFEALFTGDIDGGKEEDLAGSRLEADILKAAHHGSGYSTTEAFLERVSPKLSVISVGRNNYGHPSPKVLERMRQAGCKVCRTDENGAVTVVTDGERMQITTMR